MVLLLIRHTLASFVLSPEAADYMLFSAELSVCTRSIEEYCWVIGNLIRFITQQVKNVKAHVQL